MTCSLNLNVLNNNNRTATICAILLKEQSRDFDPPIFSTNKPMFSYMTAILQWCFCNNFRLRKQLLNLIFVVVVVKPSFTIKFFISNYLFWQHSVDKWHCGACKLNTTLSLWAWHDTAEVFARSNISAKSKLCAKILKHKEPRWVGIMKNGLKKIVTLSL